MTKCTSRGTLERQMNEQLSKYMNESTNQAVIHMCGPALGTTKPFPSADMQETNMVVRPTGDPKLPFQLTGPCQRR